MNNSFYQYNGNIYRIKLPEEIQKKIDSIADLYMEIIYDSVNTLYCEEDDEEPLQPLLDLVNQKIKETIQDRLD